MHACHSAKRRDSHADVSLPIKLATDIPVSRPVETCQAERGRDKAIVQPLWERVRWLLP